MSFRRVSGLALVAFATLLWMACGDYYRPVVFPINSTQTNPANFHTVWSINSNGSYTATPPVGATPLFTYSYGSAMQIDVSGDSVLASTGGLGDRDGHLNINQTSAVVLPNFSRVFVASAGSIEAGGADVVSSFASIIQGLTISLGTVSTATLPNTVGSSQNSSITSISAAGTTVTVTLAIPFNTLSPGAEIVVSGVTLTGNPAVGAYNGTFTISSISGNTVTYTDPAASGLPAVTASGTAAGYPGFCRYLPDAVAAAQNSTVYVANYGEENGATCNLASTDSIAVLNSLTNAITNLVYMTAGSHPIAAVQAVNSNTNKLYTANAGNSSISSFNTVDMSTNSVIGFTYKNPAWMLATVDGQKVYIVTQGDGQLVTLDTATDTVTATQPVGAGANYIAYEPNHSRVFVTNPMTSTVYVFSTSTANESPSPIASFGLLANGAGSTANYPSCVNPCPISVAALPDGSRAYVASYTLSGCSDPTYSATCVITPQVTIINLQSNTIKATLPLTATGAAPVTESIDCVPQGVDGTGAVIPYSPAGLPAPGISTPRFMPRFRMSAAAAADSSHVYISVCDAGTVADIITTTNPLSLGNEQPDSLVANIPAPFSVGFPASATGLPPYQNPILLLPGQ